MNKENQILRRFYWILGACVVVSVAAGAVVSVLSLWWTGFIIGSLLLHVSTRIVQLIASNKLDAVSREDDLLRYQEQIRAEKARYGGRR